MTEDDELLQEFLAESSEHLARIESQLLTLEEQGVNADHELVNVVFRAAHSIKGGSGFFNLKKVQELAHRIETVLSMMRNSEIHPNSEVVNILLLSFDKLRDLLLHHDTSEFEDISDHLVALNGLTSIHLPQEKKEALYQTSTITTNSGREFVVPKLEYDRVITDKQFLYYVKYDLLVDIDRQGKSILKLFDNLIGCGTILESRVALDAIGSLEDDFSGSVPYELLFATVIDPFVAEALFEIPGEQFELLIDPRKPASEQAIQAHPVTTKAALSEPEFVPTTPVENEASLLQTVEVPEPSLIQMQPRTTAEAPKPAATTTATTESASADTTLRVNINLLESLMTLAGELVLSRNQLIAAVTQQNQLLMSATANKINAVTSELQETIMQTRMQPIGNVFAKFPRLVRDLSRDLGKDVQLRIEGKDVELDKSLIEGLNDPLTHMVRNSLDHGIETTGDRIQAGKPATGTINLRAFHEAGQVVIEINDDGKGINSAKVAAAAVSKGLISEAKINAMSEKDQLSLIFLPGLSTKEKVTDLSGRGVGMDVVKTNLDRLGGKIEIESNPGLGTQFRIKLPLTLAIIPSLIVSVQGERFAIPQMNVLELIRITPDQVRARIETIAGSEVLVLRGNLIPIVNFAKFLGVEPKVVLPDSNQELLDRRTMITDRRANQYETDVEREQRLRAERRTAANSALNLVVLTTGIMQYALLVNEFHNTEEIVVKPLGQHLKGLPEYAGATIMGDGRVAMILDVGSLTARAGLTPLTGTARATNLKKQEDDKALQERMSLLTFQLGGDEQCAVPLDLVQRVERIEHHQVEYIAGKRTMQYRGFSLPLVALHDVASVTELQSDQQWMVIVTRYQEHDVGLLCSMPVDAISVRATIDHSTHKQPGIYGSSIIDGKTVLFVDLFDVIERTFPEWVTATDEVTTSASGNLSRTILLAEDSDFFRNQVRKFIESVGYTVLAAEDGQAAWELLQQQTEPIRGVVTDIEMPRMTGLELTRKIRADSRFAHLPIIGLTSLAGEEDIAIGKAAGIDDYQIKLDRDRLLEGLQALVGA